MERNREERRGKIFVISGPSGSGKTTLRDALLKDRLVRKLFVKSVSFTTRKKRTGEKNGKDYCFITEREFKGLLKAKKILEWTKYLGYYYATSKPFVDDKLGSGKNIILCLDLKGASRIKKIYPKSSVTVFILPPSISELRRRIEGRCAQTKAAEVKKRLGLAQKELASAPEFNYRVVNSKLGQASRELKNIIIKETVQG